MLRIIRNTALLISLLLNFLILSSATAADYSVTITFDKVKPVKDLTLSQIIPTPFVPEKVDGIQVEVTEALTGADFRHVIPDSRIRLLLNGQPFQLTNSPITVNFANQIKTADQMNPALELKMKPEDRADNYTGKITLKTWNNGSGGKTWQSCVVIKLTVAIQPWIKIQCEPHQIVLDQISYTPPKLVNPEPLQLRIASNSNWVLSCNLTATDCELQPIVKVNSGQVAQLQIVTQNIGIGVNRQNLAFGTATVTGNNYWLELGMTIEIKNWAKYASKKYNIPIQFTASLRDT